MKAVGADHQIEPPLRPAPEFHPDVVRPLLHADDFVVEDDFRRAFDGIEQQPRKIAAPQRHEASSGKLAKDLRPEAGHPRAAGVDDPHLPHMIADALDVGREPHALGDVVAEAPEVDDIAGPPQRRRLLDQHRLEAGGLEPEGERRAGDACARDQDRRILHWTNSSL